MKKDTPEDQQQLIERKSVVVEMCFWLTRVYLCTIDKKMFTAMAGLLSCPLEVSIYLAALRRQC